MFDLKEKTKIMILQSFNAAVCERDKNLYSRVAYADAVLMTN